MPTSFQNSPYFICHYGVKGRSGKEGAGMWYKNGQLTEAGRQHYYGERRQQVFGSVLPKQVSSSNNNEKNSEYYQKKRDQHANAAAKATAQHFIASVANVALSAAAMKNGGNSGKGLASLLNSAAVGVRIGSAISGTAHTVAWAYNSVKKRQMDKKEKKESEQKEEPVKKEEPIAKKEKAVKAEKPKNDKKESAKPKDKGTSKKEPDEKYAKTKMTQKKAIDTAYNDIEKMYPNYWQMSDSKRDQIWIDYVNKSGLYRWL